MKLKTIKTLIVTGAILILIGILSFLINQSFANAIISGGIIFTGSVILLYVYLQGGFKRDLKTDGKIKLEGNSNIIYNNVGSVDSLSAEILQLIREKHEQWKYIELLDYVFKFRNRIKKHSETISRNGNLNLILGLVITSISVVLLLYLSFSIKSGLDDYFKFLSHYIPRILVVLFIETFALFFLKLYKGNLDEVRFFQNELTNIDNQMIALKTALLIEDKEAIKDVIATLSMTERNFKLKKDETTIDLEKIKTNKDNDRLLTDKITDLLKAVSSINSDKKDNK